MSAIHLPPLMTFLVLCVGLILQTVVPGTLAQTCSGVTCSNNGTCTAGVCSCPSGYSGTYCDVLDSIDFCARDTPCQNNGTCANMLNDYVCTCMPDWTDKNCTTPITTTTSTTTTSTTTSSSTATTPATSSTTTTILTTNPTTSIPTTSAVTTLATAAVICPPNKSGANCSVLDVTDWCVSANPCQNNGTCMSTTAKAMCNCTELWTDDNCTTPLCPPFNETALELQGTETLVPENYTEVYQIGGASLTIECPDGRTYPNVTACQITHDYSSFTVEEWCLITTTTSSTTTTTVDTTTTEPTSASTTTTPATTTIPITTTTTVVTTTIAAACVTLNCKNGGTCVVGGKGASCSCAAGFSGTFCQDLDVVDYCALYNWPCQNNGTCSSAAPGYVCSCTTLWTGQNCTIPLCPPFNATLLQLDNTETLSPVNITQGYQVANTSLNITCPDGTVHLDVTTCQSTHNYTAFTPIVWCPTTTTSTTSTSTSTTTSIESTTTTEITDITTTPSVTTSVMAETTTVGACTAANCVYGTCDPSGGTCICDSGYSGTACDVADVVDYCKYANPCQNNGTCLNTVGGATCNCTELWTGANCTIPLCPPFDETLLQLQGNEKLEPTNFTSVNQTGGSSLDIICPDGTKYLNVTFCQTTHDYSTFTPQAIWCPETTTSSSTTETTDSSTTDVSTTIETSTNDLSTTTVSTAIISTVTPYIPVTVADCSTNPCYNGGTCISTGTYNYCNCTPGYTGSNCQQQEVIDPCTDSFSNDPCLTVNHTHCVVVNETNYYCQCDYLWGRTVNCTDDLSTCLNVSCEIPLCTWPPVDFRKSMYNVTEADNDLYDANSATRSNETFVVHTCSATAAFYDYSTGPRTYTCQTNNTWSNVIGPCKQMCMSLPAANYTNATTNATTVDMNYPPFEGAMIYHVCDTGYAFPDGSSVKNYRCQTNGKWSGVDGSICMEITTTTSTTTTSTTSTTTTEPTTTTTTEPTTTTTMEPTTTTSTEPETTSTSTITTTTEPETTEMTTATESTTAAATTTAEATTEVTTVATTTEPSTDAATTVAATTETSTYTTTTQVTTEDPTSMATNATETTTVAATTESSTAAATTETVTDATVTTTAEPTTTTETTSTTTTSATTTTTEEPSTDAETTIAATTTTETTSTTKEASTAAATSAAETTTAAHSTEAATETTTVLQTIAPTTEVVTTAADTKAVAQTTAAATNEIETTTLAATIVAATSEATTTTATTTARVVVMCPDAQVNFINAEILTNYIVGKTQKVGTEIIHKCLSNSEFASDSTVLRIYTCLANGTWSQLTNETCSLKSTTSTTTTMAATNATDTTTETATTVVTTEAATSTLVETTHAPTTTTDAVTVEATTVATTTVEPTTITSITEKDTAVASTTVEPTTEASTAEPVTTTTTSTTTTTTPETTTVPSTTSEPSTLVTETTSTTTLLTTTTTAEPTSTTTTTTAEPTSTTTTTTTAEPTSTTTTTTTAEPTSTTTTTTTAEPTSTTTTTEEAATTAKTSIAVAETTAMQTTTTTEASTAAVTFISAITSSTSTSTQTTTIKKTTLELTTSTTTTAPPVLVDCYGAVTCENNGECQGLYNASYCGCAEGYTGATCQQEMLNPCSSSPCAGIKNVQCIRQSDTAYICQCAAGYAQTDSCRANPSCADCETPLCEWPPVDLKNSYIYNETDPGTAVGLTSKYREAGTVVVHKCNANNSFPDGSTTPRVYTCTNDHSWINVNGPCNEPECPKNNQLVCSGDSCVCIFLPSEPSAWDQLRTLCAGQGNMLPVLNNQFKWSEFQKVRSPKPALENVWIGLHIIGTIAGGGGNAYEWADNSTFKVGDFAPWAPGQPNTKSETAYCVVSRVADNYLWSLHDCSDYLIYGICFVPPPPPPTCDPPTVDMSHSTTESNVSSVTGSVIWGTTTVHNCMDGYAFNNYQTKRIYQCWKNSTWLYTGGPCIRMCKSLPNVGYSNAVTNSSLVKTLPFEKTSISHVCSAGFSFPDGSTEKFYVCLSNGTWSNVGDSCQIATTTTTLATTSMARSTSTASTPAATFMASTTAVTTTKATTKTTTTEATTPSTTTAPPVIVDCYHNETCQNDGQCEGLIDASHCVCTDGYTGATCQQIKYNPCSSSPCAGIHNVECVRQSDTAFVCQCKVGFAQTDSCRADSSCSDCDVPLCEWPPVDLKNSYIYNETDPGTAVGLTSKYREAGTVVVHKCNANNSFPDGSTPPRTYTCTNDHSWINVNGPCNEPECPKNNQLVCSDASCVCIFLPSEPSAWDQLRTMCADSGSMLPVLSNQFKWSEFQKVRPPTAYYENVWIGLHIIGTIAGGGGNAYEWADNSTFKIGDFAPWAPGQPNTKSETAYCVVSRVADNYLWSLHDCSDYSIYGICFVPPPPPPTCDPPTVDMSHSTTESNVSSVTGSVIWGTTTVHNCMDGYAFDNYQTKRIYQCWKNSTWLYEKGPCIRLCKSLPMVDFSNADTNCTTIKSLPFEGTTVYHHCSDGFTFPDGSKDRTYACLSNGTWSNVDGACTEATTTTVTTTTQLAATAAATTTVAKPSTSSTTTSTTTRTTTVKTTTTKPPTKTATTTTKAAAATTTKAAATTTSTKAPQTPAPTTPYLPPPTTTTTAAPVHVDCYHNVKCENGGTCEGLFDNSYCTCTAKFTGTLCTEPYIDPCASNPCTARHVVCVRQSNTAFSCQCAAGWGRTEACSAVSTCSDCDIPLCNWPPVDLKNSAIYNQTHTGPYIVTGLTSINRENGTVVVHKCNPNNAFPDGTTGARTYVCTNDHTWMNVDGPCNPPICPPSSDPDCSGAQCVCLQIPGDPSAWDEASANCKAGGSMLAILDTSHEWSEFLKLRVNYDYLNKAWIGLHIVGATTQGAPVYEWADGKPFNPSTDFAPWAPGEPKTANGKCVASLLTPDNFLWTLHDCSDYDNYGICYIPPLPPPQCDPPVVNMQFSTPESNASSLTDKVIWGTELIHNCLPGYTFSNYQNKRTYQCWSNHTWLYLDGPCLRICKSLPSANLYNADSNATTITAYPFQGISVSHICHAGFSFPDGSTKRFYTCQSDGTWSNVGNDSCIETITTTGIPTLFTVTEIATTTTPSTTSTAGPTALGTTTPTTTVTSTTTTTVKTSPAPTEPTQQPTTTAAPIRCPSVVIDTSRSSGTYSTSPVGNNQYMKGSTLTHKCKSGNYFNDTTSTKKYTCLSNGTWSGYNPQNICSAMCPVPPINYKYSQIEKDTSKQVTKPSPVGTTVLVLCITNYMYSDASPLRVYKCRPDLTWSENPGPENACKITCPVPGANYTNAGTNTQKLTTRSFVGTTLIHNCAAGTQFKGGSTKKIYTCNANGQWTNLDKTDYCSAPVITCPAPRVDWTDAQDPSEDYSGVQLVGTTIEHECNDGYTFPQTDDNKRVYTCLSNGTWVNLNGERCERDDVPPSYLGCIQHFDYIRNVCLSEPQKTRDDGATYALSKNYCENMILGRTRMATFKSLNEYEFYRNELKKRGLAKVWMYIYYDYLPEHAPNDYRWDGYIPITFPGPFNPYPPEVPKDIPLCVYADKSKNYDWSTMPCTNNASFICSMDPVALTTTTTTTTEIPDPSETTDTTIYIPTEPPTTESTESTTTSNESTTSSSTTTTTTRPLEAAGVLASTDRFVPTPMSGAARTAATVVASMGCSFLVASLASVVALYILFRSNTTQGIVIGNQNTALLIAHVLVLTLREPGMYPHGIDPTLCRWVAILLHYFFLAGYTFMLLEAVQTMVLIGNVIPRGSLFSWQVNLAIGWGGPFILVGISAPFIGSEYSTSWTCWGDLAQSLCWGLLFPMACICAAALVCVEAGGMMGRHSRPFPNIDPVQRTSAHLSRGALPLIMILTVGSHLIGMAAVYFQLIYLYGVCFFMNIINAVVVFVSHTSMDTKIRTFTMKWTGKAVNAVKKKKVSSQSPQ